MLEKLKHTFALSDQGAKDMVKAFFACILHNLSLMVPVVLLYNLISDLLDGGIPYGKSTFYIVGLAIALGLIMLTCYIQYNATFFATYVESGVRRLSLAEKLRKIPMVHKKCAKPCAYCGKPHGKAASRPPETG